MNELLHDQTNTESLFLRDAWNLGYAAAAVKFIRFALFIISDISVFLNGPDHKF